MQEPLFQGVTGVGVLVVAQSALERDEFPVEEALFVPATPGLVTVIVVGTAVTRRLQWGSVFRTEKIQLVLYRSIFACCSGVQPGCRAITRRVIRLGRISASDGLFAVAPRLS
jgi:hypothetical protein